MGNAQDAPWKYIIMWIRIVFGVHLIYSGLAYIIAGWTPSQMMMQDGASGQFQYALDLIGMYPMVKYLELIVGIALVLDIAVPLALILELPTTLMISFLNIVVEGTGRELFTGPQELLLNVSLLFAYGGYYTGFLQVRARPWWLWSNLPATRFAPEADAEVRPRRQGFAVAVMAALTFGILAASALLPPPERRLTPRDYTPLVVAALAVGFVLVRDRRRPSADGQGRA